MKPKGKRFSDEPKETPRHEAPEAFDAESEEFDDPTIDDEVDEDVEEFRKKEALKQREREEKQKQKNEEKLKKLMKKLMKKREKRDAYSDRQVLSYEDMPLEEREERKTPEKKLNVKRVLLAVLIVAVLALAVFFIAGSDNLSFDSAKNFVEYGILGRDSDERFPLSIQGENITNGNFSHMGNYLAFTSDTKFETVNTYGKVVFSVQNGFSNPVLVTAHDRSLVYNLGGTGFEINSLDASVYSSTAENNIFVADIVDNGTYALVTQSDGYLSKLYVYDEENTKIFAYSFADYYVTSVSLNSSGREAVVSGVSALDGSEISAVYVLDFTKEEPILFREFEGNLIYKVKYLTDSQVCIIGSNAAYGMRVHSGDIKETLYNGRTLTAYDINSDTNTFAVSLSRSGDTRNCDILCFNTTGALANTIETDLRIISLSTYKSHIAVLSGDTVYLYAKDSRLLSQTVAGIDPHAVVLHSQNQAYVLGTSDIVNLDL